VQKGHLPGEGRKNIKKRQKGQEKKDSSPSRVWALEARQRKGEGKCLREKKSNRFAA